MSFLLTEHAISLNKKSARYYQMRDNSADEHAQASKPHAHFYAGNGFVAGVYQPLLENLATHFNISSLAMRGYWYDKPKVKTHEKVLTREQDADALIEFLKATQNKPVVGIGHSQGATATAIAAAKYPELFEAVYLIEPVTFTKHQKIIYDRVPRWVKMLNEPFKSTAKKPTQWVSVETYYQFLRNHRAYKRISDEHLHIYAANSLVKTTAGSLDSLDNSNNFELLFLPEQEMANYFGTPCINDALKILNKTHVPYHLIIGKPSMFISEKVRKSWQGFIPSTQLTVMAEYGHLLPMEAPDKVAKMIIASSQ